MLKTQPFSKSKQNRTLNIINFNPFPHPINIPLGGRNPPTCLGERDELPAPVLLGALQLVHLVPAVAALKWEHNSGPGLVYQGKELCLKIINDQEIMYTLLIAQFVKRKIQKFQIPWSSIFILS